MKHIRKLTSWLLAIALIFTLLPVVAIRARAEVTWGDGEDGTSAHPYQIDSKEKLEAFRDIVNGVNGNPAACAELTRDIVLGNVAWTPIGEVYNYTGTFDGKDHSITGLKVNGDNYCGLFGIIEAGGTVRNVSVSGNVTGSGYYVGGVVGANYGTVENCSNACTVNEGGSVGGVMGYNSSNGTVTNCYNTGSVTGTGDDVGGVVGDNRGMVTNCYNTGSVTGNTEVGGVVGYNTDTVTNCYNTGSVTGASVVGGVVGNNTDTVTNCYYRTYSELRGIGSGDGTVMAVPDLDKVVYTWSELYEALQINGSVIALGADVTYGTGDGAHASDGLVVPENKTVDLDLTGHVIDRGLKNAAAVDDGSVITVCGNLTITDSSEGGTITGGKISGYGHGGGVNIAGGSFTLEGGTISGNTASSGGGVNVATGGSFIQKGGTISDNTATNGGGVNVATGGSFIQKGGTISDNTASSYGGGVYIDISGIFTLEDGTISSNTAGYGGGVYIDTYGSFTLEDGAISDNTASNKGGGVYCNGTFNLSGGATISDNHNGANTNDNVYLLSGKTITVTDALTDTTLIGVTMQTPDTFTIGLGIIVSGNTPCGTASNFTSDNAAYGVALDEYGEAYLVPRESTPEAIFTATGADCGELRELNAGETYTLSGAGLTAADITADTNGKYTTSGLTAGTLSIVKKGDGSTTVDSEAKTIVVEKASVPTDPAKTDCTTLANDGKITGVTAEMEYKKSDAAGWTDGTGNDITGLTPGTYYVRVKATGATLASENQELTIAVSYKTVTSVGKIRDGEVYMAIDMPPGVPPIAVSGITEDFAASLLSETELERVRNGAKLTITLDMENKDATVTEDEKSSLSAKAKAVGGNGTVVRLYLDIKLSYQIGEDEPILVSNTGKNIVHMVLTVPEDLRNKDKKKTRTFFILRFHDVAEMLAKGKGTEIPFDSDRFSTFALAYNDKQNSGGGGGGGTTYTYYTVKFEMNGHGEQVSSQTVRSGLKAKRPEDPTAEEYYFAGWFEDSELTKEYDFSSPVRKSMTLYARWEEIRYTVSFDLNGHGSSIETQWVRKNGMAEKPEDPSAEGYSFDGWYLDSDCTKLYDFSSPVTKDITLYAKWVKDVLVYRLYNPNSGAHLFTSNTAEKDNLVLIRWEYEGVAWTAPESSNIPVYRVYNPNSGEHHYTMNAAEKDILVALGWNDEGICWYSDENQGTPLYRLYNPNAVGQYAAGAHHYTKDVEERDYLIAAGWNDEGIGWYGK